MQQMFLKGLDPSCNIHTSKRLSNYTISPSEHIQLTFTDGSQVECDVLIGADGLRSAVRRIMSEEKPEVPANPIWTGTTCYRYFISTEQLRKRMPKNAALQNNVMIVCLTLIFELLAMFVNIPSDSRYSISAKIGTWSHYS